jgi:hypothetical protein
MHQFGEKIQLFVRGFDGPLCGQNADFSVADQTTSILVKK